MGRYIQQNETRSELQQRLDAELRAKAAANAKQDGGGAGGKYDRPDGVEDAAYMKGTKATTTLAPIWAIIGIAAVVVFVYFIIEVSQ